MKKEAAHLIKPIVIGVAILDTSNTILCEAHYNGVKVIWEDNAIILYTDTNSLIYCINSENMYEEMHLKRKWFDMCQYKSDHPPFSKFKDDSNNNK